MKKLLLIPLACAGVFIAVRMMAASPEAAAKSQQILNLVYVILACVGPVIGAMCFDRGDHLRRAWLCFGLGAAFLLVNRLSALFQVTGPPADIMRIGSVFFSNVSTSVGAILFARTAGVAGIELPGSAMSRATGRLLAAGFALALFVPAVEPAISRLAGGAPLTSGLVPIFASLGDAISLALIAPILFTALALRGGLVAWPWILLTGSELCWLLFDAQISIYPKSFPPIVLVFAQSFRMAAFGFAFAAGLAQRRVSSAR